MTNGPHLQFASLWYATLQSLFPPVLRDECCDWRGYDVHAVNCALLGG
jgi:hypothetical protein